MAATELDQRIAAIVEPLRQELREIDREIAGAERDLARLKESRRRVNGIIRQANGDVKKPGPKGAAPRASVVAVDYVREFLQRDGMPDEIIASRVYQAILTDARERGLAHREYPGEGAVRLAIKEMHTNGELRLARKSTGGSPVYVRT